jgi:hypothetical protein
LNDDWEEHWAVHVGLIQAYYTPLQIRIVDLKSTYDQHFTNTLQTLFGPGSEVGSSTYADYEQEWARYLEEGTRTAGGMF